jgi:hypothetical protein
MVLLGALSLLLERVGLRLRFHHPTYGNPGSGLDRSLCDSLIYATANLILTTIQSSPPQRRMFVYCL